MSNEVETKIFRKGGIREVLFVGINYLTQVINSSKDEPSITQKATEEREKLLNFRASNLTKLKHLGVLEDKEKISLMLEGEIPDGTYFLLNPIGFIKVEDPEYVQKIASILKTKKYFILENHKPNVMEV